ncbi:cephalosporin hydroxylase [Streptomyces sp. LBL]|uniref:CmcI family methyltransferase n=1 Tax=Streptomyces sp. LBL TaxID=2940562 RepID=UPI0024768C4F|nr:CmcI family methyltransferase [Streptomyces sp. LBL]MDH6622927.1 cephalosporin hydroxylase [Streptomyces sp. LBL]
MDEINELAETAERLVAAKAARQGGISTYHDHHIRGAVTEARRTGRTDELTEYLALLTAERFRDPLPRLDRSDREVLAALAFPVRNFVATQGVTDHLTWAGRPLYKTVFDLASYPMLIAELTPGTIIELGSGSGGSALWLADVAEAHDLLPVIISIDRTAVDLADNRVSFRTGDVGHLSEVLADCDDLPRPWLVIEDAHAHVRVVLDFFDARLAAGDYLLVEDSLAKRATLREFLRNSPHQYQLDTRYLDLFGENTSCAIDSIFRRA